MAGGNKFEDLVDVDVEGGAREEECRLHGSGAGSGLKDKSWSTARSK